MTKKSIALYLGIIGLLLVIAIGWYVYALQIEPSAPTIVPGESAVSTEAGPGSVSTAPAQTDSGPPAVDTPTTDTPVPSTLPPPETSASVFDGERAYADVQAQVGFGPRIVGTEGHAKVLEWIREELMKAGWQVEIQESEALGHPIKNIVAKRNDAEPEIILGAHYDTRMFADNDPDPANHTIPVPGANDGASGVAILLELARSLPQNTVPVWLVFFDAEDNGRIEGWDWTLGSPEFVRNNAVQPRAVVVVDMIGDADLNVYQEYNSDAALTTQIWETAADLGYGSQFIPEYKHSMQDDHRPFLQAGIRAVLLIDFDYPYWHTIEDTPDKVSAASLEAVGKTLWSWITQQSRQN